MSADLAVQIAFWIVLAHLVAGVAYVAHRLTASTAKRLKIDHKQQYYAQLAHRGHDVRLPATWISGGLAGHDRNSDREFRRSIGVAGLAILAAFALGIWLRSDVITPDQVLGEAIVGLVIVGGMFLGIRALLRRRVSKTLSAAGPLAPRSGSQVVANAHGLLVPVSDRIVDGAWSDWIVADAEIEFDKYGQGHCFSITVAHRSRSEEKIPLIASTFENGADLMAVLAARIARPA